ncbi:hypothetical protein H696_04636 [Fonticula alba]|uniref:Uncharacterized protein n=1 Tax=Fonticula alba TaxID=691883 RepID=A0A058Z4K3_FONAL|nr:hypothetical protein H696_04636 [Fonticula alba]KCV69219.1 hypothetical protein H696_04636 [Fonticula alba]|eukprot:XP_009496790.1 hypothetical protein H696_04636 [Fonticula alba]
MLARALASARGRSPHLAARAAISSSAVRPAPHDNPELIRSYFYFVDEHGRLFLDGTRMKNFVSCFKEADFLRMFFSAVRPAGAPPPARPAAPSPPSMLGPSSAEGAVAASSLHYWPEPDRLAAFRWVSPCAGEYNYIAADDTPVVFTLLERRPVATDAPGTVGHSAEQQADPGLPHAAIDPGQPYDLCWAADRRVPFRPELLRADPRTGRLYYPAPLRTLRRGDPARARVEATADAAGIPSASSVGHALVASRVTIALMPFLLGAGDDGPDGGAWSLEWPSPGSAIPIPALSLKDLEPAQ